MKYTICMEGQTFNLKEYIVTETNSLDYALEVYSKVEEVCNLVGKCCWLRDNDIDEDIKFNY